MPLDRLLRALRQLLKRPAGIALLVATLALAGIAEAQRSSPQGGSDKQNVAGEFDYYALVLSWSPTFCQTREDKRYSAQCDRKNGRRYAFVLHGLWPQYNRGYPENCRIGRRPFVPQPVIDSMLDIMPAPGLVIHEYRKHGTCTGLSPEAYYGLSRRLFDSIQIPRPYQNPYENRMVSPDRLISEFLAVNPNLTRDMVRVSCRGSGNRLREVKVCFSKNGKPTPCGFNERQDRLCRANTMFVPPVRSSAVPNRR